MRRKAGKILAAALSLTILFTMGGCGGSATDPAAGEPGQAVTDDRITGTGETENEISNADTRSGQEPVTITWWCDWTGENGEIVKNLVADYNEKNTDNVTLEVDFMEGSALTEKLAAALANNTNPNLFSCVTNDSYLRDGMLMPITDIFEKTDLDESDFNPDILESEYFDGELYGIPFWVSTCFLIWNKDLYERAGLDPDTPPANWDEMLEFSAKIDQVGENIHGGGFDFNNRILVGTIMRSNGGNVVGKDENGNMKSVLLDPEYIEGNRKTLEFYYNYAHQDDWNMLNESYGDGFVAGNVAMVISAPWDLYAARANGINYGVSLLPKGTDGIAQCGQPYSLCVLKNTTEREMEGVYSFLEFWNNNINNPITDEPGAYQLTKELLYQPYLYSVANDPRLADDPDLAVTNTYLDYFEYFVPTECWNLGEIMNNVLIPMTQNVMYDMMTIDEALEDADKTLTEIISRTEY